MTVLRTALWRASPVGMEEAVERRRSVNSTQGLLGRFSRRSAVPSSRDWLCGGEGAESVSLELGGWDSTTDTSGQAGLHWPPIGAACRSVRLPVPDGVGVGFEVAWALTTWPPLTTWFQPGPSFSSRNSSYLHRANRPLPSGLFSTIRGGQSRLFGCFRERSRKYEGWWHNHSRQRVAAGGGGTRAMLAQPRSERLWQYLRSGFEKCSRFLELLNRWTESLTYNFDIWNYYFKQE
jgi:hypothetical protein